MMPGPELLTLIVRHLEVALPLAVEGIATITPHPAEHAQKVVDEAPLNPVQAMGATSRADGRERADGFGCRAIAVLGRNQVNPLKGVYAGNAAGVIFGPATARPPE